MMIRDTLTRAQQRDVVDRTIHDGKSLLLVGPPGAGKTTVLRSVAAQIAAERTTSIIDTSNEICGDGTKHRAVGDARRFSVPADRDQADVMLEVIQNHTPEVIIIDEIGTGQQARAANTIRQRGVVMVATVHGHTLADVRGNRDLNSLLGGFESVILGDAAQKDRGASSKTVSERAGKPVFDMVVELRGVGDFVVHDNAAASVDALLAAPEKQSRAPPSRVSHRWTIADGRQFARYEHFGGGGQATRHKRSAGDEQKWLGELTEMMVELRA